jgi:uncharacterized repeat protein (TIGR03803 family)
VPVSDERHYEFVIPPKIDRTFVVGDVRFGQQDVHVPWHAAGHGMDSELHIHAAFDEGIVKLPHLVLRLRDPNPEAGLLRDPAGNLYGVAGGGAQGAGVVFRIDPAGKEAVLYSFGGGADGKHPKGGLVRGPAGAFYGTADGGVTTDFCYADRCGVVFKLDASGKEAVLYSFTGGPDGLFPNPGIQWDSAGNLYGTTSGGGASGAGVVYRVEGTGHEAVLYSFTGGADGASPIGGLWRDSAGDLYGAAGGGATDHNCVSGGCGVVFKVDPTGKRAVLHRFTGGTDGANPMAGLVGDQDGNLYGTAIFGGNTSGVCASYRGCGVVFKLDSAGKETVLYSFTGGADGLGPAAGLLRDAAGNLYGTTSMGGTSCGPVPGGCGVVFKVDSTGKETVLYRFKGGADGQNIPLPIFLE